MSFASLLTEIVLTRIFSVTLGYHFAFFVISLAMLGLSFGSAFLFMFKGKFLNIPIEKILYSTFLVTAVGFTAILIVVPKINFLFNLEPKAFLLALILFLICQFPFFMVGFLTSYLFMNLSKESGKIYFFDLVGAGAGALFSVLLINYLGAINSLIFLGIISSIALLINSLPKKLIISVVVFITFITLMIINYRLGVFNIPSLKVNNLFTKWNSFSMIRVYGNENSLESVPTIWGMSSEYQGTYPPALSMDIDANAFSPIIKFDGDFKKLENLKYNVISLGYYLTNSPNVLIMGPGGGKDALTALLFNSKKILGVEINPTIVNDVMKKRFKEYSGNLYNLDSVEIVVDDARSYIRNSKEKYDIIQASLVDTWAAANTGAYSLSENNIYTVEAMSEFINHLSPNGYLSISRWYGGDSEKLAVIYLKAAEKLVIQNANKHIAIVQGGDMVTLLFKKTELDNSEIEKILQIANQMKFKILYLPGSKETYEYSGMINSQNLDQFINNNSDIYLKASTDDSPFFFNKIPFYSVPSVLSGAVQDVGIFLLYGLFIICLFLSLTLITAQLYFNRYDLFENEAKTKFNYLAFFSLLGMGFMLSQMSFLQKFMIFLGHPTYSILVVIFSLLIFAGIGSFLTTRITQNKLKSRLSIILIIIIAVMLCYNFGLSPLFNVLLGLQIKFRILISIFLLSIMGIFMGMPFPIGIRSLGLQYKELIPFCWSLNGVFSVLGSILAVILAMNIGFTKTIFFAAGLYFIALIIFNLIKIEFKE